MLAHGHRAEYAPCAESGPIFNFQSLIQNYERCCGVVFWLCARRRRRSIPAAGCDDRTNAAHGQKNRRPDGCRAKGQLALLLLSQRPVKGISPRCVSPSNLLPSNSATRSFESDSHLGKNTPKRKDYIMDQLVVPVEE